MTKRRRPFDYKVKPLVIVGGVEITFFSAGERVGSVVVKGDARTYEFGRQLTQSGRGYMMQETEELVRTICTSCGAHLHTESEARVELERVMHTQNSLGDLAWGTAKKLEDDLIRLGYKTEVETDTALETDVSCNNQSHVVLFWSKS